MAKGDLLRQHIAFYGAALTALEGDHTDLLAHLTEPKPHSDDLHRCPCFRGEAWRWFRRQQVEVERKLYRVR